MHFLVQVVLMCLILEIIGCSNESEISMGTRTSALIEFECGFGIQYPVSEEQFHQVYGGRIFYAPGGPGNHLGYDIELPEGEPVSSIACGRVVYYGPASGYGTLVVAIEHVLSHPIIVVNGAGEESFCHKISQFARTPSADKWKKWKWCAHRTQDRFSCFHGASSGLC